MHLLLLNGSPKGESGNSNYLLQLLLEGVEETPGHTHEFANLARVKEHRHYVELFQQADVVIMAFPLYIDMMPGVVKAFIEELEPLCGRESNPALGCIIQCGFPESVDLRALEAYLEKLSRRLGCLNLGTALRAGGGSVRDMPAFMVRGFTKSMHALGRSLGKTGNFDPEVIRRLAGTEKLPLLRLWFMGTLGDRMARVFFWHRGMKKNGAYERRLARPYAEPPPGW
ncbi:NAD(P)H-dependent oxidoreductase [Chloroflexota bacterium]